ncbi:MAG: DUF4062 domain-containing protein, partial [Rhodocyclaceae bacterium]|nr:DUF4062 domain-containing protein [Rhodocyclaceae bacterium]
MPERERKAFISTSAIDLPEHREQAAEACRQMGWRPLMQGQGAAEDPELLPTRLNAIDGCELFIGICGFRYGYVPQGHKLSIGELEYERAKARGIPCLVYFADDTHARLEEPVRSGMEDAKLERFKKRVASEQSVTLFANAQDLYERVLRALAALREDGAGPQIVSPGTGGVRIEGLQPSVLQGRAPNIQPRRILLPDIDWVEIPAGQFVYQKGERRTLPRFFVARYPVTNIQYQTFIAAGGYADERWWKDLVKPEPQPSRWPQPNRPKT